MDILAELSDILLGAGALGAGIYCLVLSRRLRRFTDLERGVGGAVAVLSAQVDDLSRSLQRAEGAAKSSVDTLAQASERAEAAGKRLELLMASMHDLPGSAEDSAKIPGPVFIRHPSALGRPA
ncbi:hypothetical protein FHG66_05285 [Rubellimicrobium rubrum]|uniref:Uncharacterized protein n=1 Tax=Rubellimicrobium rubrum TaxID=2585369 RepID=A0A5C4N415_9RHOB|nr:hypothetical protein [Rubellimicrobium rubrum]TNC51577.1 hypothetical protein FHG66_05285 [Rubellimicrobium rubrum]